MAPSRKGLTAECQGILGDKTVQTAIATQYIHTDMLAQWNMHNPTPRGKRELYWITEGNENCTGLQREMKIVLDYRGK